LTKVPYFSPECAAAAVNASRVPSPAGALGGQLRRWFDHGSTAGWARGPRPSPFASTRDVTRSRTSPAFCTQNEYDFGFTAANNSSASFPGDHLHLDADRRFPERRERALVRGPDKRQPAACAQWWHLDGDVHDGGKRNDGCSSTCQRENQSPGTP